MRVVRRAPKAGGPGTARTRRTVRALLGSLPGAAGARRAVLVLLGFLPGAAGLRRAVRALPGLLPGAAGLRRAVRGLPGLLPGAVGARRVVLVLLGSLPGVLAVVALALCARGVERAVVPGPGRAAAARPPVAHHAARPRIVPRSAWLDGTTGQSQPPPRYDDKVVAVFLHHTDSPNGYRCADAPRIIRHLYAGQTGARHWDDIGYNFLVDRCGTIYEGRAGGVDRAVTGAHAQGFNHRTAGIAALGTFTAGVPVPRAMTDAIAALAAWKLGLADADPRGRVRLVSSSGLSRYRAGATATLPVLSGHQDGFRTDCPGAALAARLPEIRQRAALLQGRTHAPGRTTTGKPSGTGKPSATGEPSASGKPSAAGKPSGTRKPSASGKPSVAGGP
ncbi:N-acetylmuramoyl-L-alanine amidase [Streptomyces sp. 5-8]|uniref:N-acetylmuramoyl-L-alanine amidase n=1 Tax=Streptomyces musisoli TaxID=2802280 RepID=A0ABS1P0T9_9ACTN|nr:N-acetylmuramoyl-L-alanine amidase [Streptomyces musisoli]MBY8844351.1 N-acetylmuramoyl-L-alanine amidase [Streptomyces sp. SP2-10]